MNSPRAFILAGGEGRRLAPLTTVIPKPLVPVGDRSIIEILLAQLVNHGIVDITIGLGHLGHLIEAVVGDGARFGASIRYTRENVPLGTAGALALIDPPITAGSEILVVNGDTYTDLDFGELLAFHRARAADATIAAFRQLARSEFGVLTVDQDSRLVSYSEKPESSTLVSMGVNLLSDRAVRLIGADERLDMPQLFVRAHESGLRVFCAELPCRWIDLGRLEDVRNANVFEAGTVSAG